MALKNRKELGQNWLNNREILEYIAAEAAGEVIVSAGAMGMGVPAEATEMGVSAEIAGFSETQASKEDLSQRVENYRKTGAICVEIGPGLGTLTTSLLRRFPKVVAIELDERLAGNLPKSFPGKNLEVVNADILKFDFSTIQEKYVIAGNIPYYITSPILEKVLNLDNPPERIVLLIQKEVAERIADKKATLLSLMVKNRAKIRLGRVVLREEFMPAPKVDSQVIILEPRRDERGKMAPMVSEKVLDFAKIGFRNPRKKLVQNLAGVKGLSKEEWREKLAEAELNPDARAGDLGLEDWQKLAK